VVAGDKVVDATDVVKDITRLGPKDVMRGVIERFHDLKTRLAKVIPIILIVPLFEYAVRMRPGHMLELVYCGGAIALVGLALYLSHAAETQGEPAQSHGQPGPPPAH
jgi:uncharacterized membrane protein YqhA